MKISAVIKLLNAIRIEQGDIEFGLRGYFTPSVDIDPFPMVLKAKVMPERANQLYLSEQVQKDGKPTFDPRYQALLEAAPEVDVFIFI